MAADDEHLGVVPLDGLAEDVPSVPLHRLKHSVADLHRTKNVEYISKEVGGQKQADLLLLLLFFF